MAWRRDDSIVMKRPSLVRALLLTLTACTGTHTSPTRAPGPTTPSTMLAPRSTLTAHASPPRSANWSARLPSPIRRGAGFPEVKGSSNKVQLWGLIMAEGADNPLRVNEQVKIVWRITGTGELHLTSIAPGGGTQPLQWGPDEHTLGSTYGRPGQEWGAGYLFTQPGCWDLHAIRGNATANVWLNIAP